MPRLRVRCIKVHGVPLEVHNHSEPPLGPDQQPLLSHLLKVGRVVLHGRPDRHHQLNAQAAKLRNHGVRVGPVRRIEAPLALGGPVEEIDDQHVEPQLAPGVLARDGQQLVLRLVPQLALPEAEAILGHRRRETRRAPVGLDNLLGRLADDNPDVELLRGSSLEGHGVRSKDRTSDGWVVPEQPIT